MFEEILTPINIMQTLGTGFGVVQVILSRQNNINNYLFGILAILLSTVVLYRSKLYGDILLNMYYLVMSVYGYFYWKYGKEKAQRPISVATLKEQFYAISIVLACFGLMYYWLAYYTNSDVPLWDAVVSAFAWAGMWLMAKRKLENWIYLNISNIISIPLLIYKELYIYAALSVFLFILGTSGYLNWRRIMRNKKEHEYITA